MIAELGQQLVLVLVILGITFAGPVAAMVLLVRRKKSTRAARRSPLTAHLLRGPGHSLRERLEDSRLDVGFDVAVLMVVPNLLLALYLLQLHFQRRPPSMWVNAVFAALCVGLIGYSIRALLRKSADMDKLRKGLDAEVAVGQELDQLMRQGAVVFHDFQAEKFNIDHVVIAPQGVFCVETKGYTKALGADAAAAARVEFDGVVLRFPGWQTSKPLEQAARNAQWLARWLSSATATEMTVIPVVALPGWFVERKGRGAARVFSGRELPSLLKAGTPNALSADKMQRAIHQVEQRCRDVKPTYRPTD
jgi:hypothetical protein